MGKFLQPYALGLIGLFLILVPTGSRTVVESAIAKKLFFTEEDEVTFAASGEEAPNIPYIDFQNDIDTDNLGSTSVQVWRIRIDDGGEDGFPARINSLSFQATRYANALNEAVLLNGSDVIGQAVNINNTTGDFTFDLESAGNSVVTVPDDGTVFLTLRVSFLPGDISIEDGDYLQFELTGATNEEDDEFSNIDPDSFTGPAILSNSNGNILEVNASQFEFTSLPNPLFIPLSSTFSYNVRAVDANGNLDEDFSAPVEDVSVGIVESGFVKTPDEGIFTDGIMNISGASITGAIGSASINVEVAGAFEDESDPILVSGLSINASPGGTLTLEADEEDQEFLSLSIDYQQDEDNPIVLQDITLRKTAGSDWEDYVDRIRVFQSNDASFDPGSDLLLSSITDFSGLGNDLSLSLDDFAVSGSGSGQYYIYFLADIPASVNESFDDLEFEFDQNDLTISQGGILPLSYSGTLSFEDNQAPTVTDVSFEPEDFSILAFDFDFSKLISQLERLDYVVSTQSSLASSTSQIRSGNFDAGDNIADHGSITDFTDLEILAEGLQPETEYFWFFVLEDEFNNISEVQNWLPSVTTLEFQAPQLNSGFPNVTGTLASATTLRVNLDKMGRAAYVVQPAIDGSPSAEQIKAGLTLNDVPAIASGIINIPQANTSYSRIINGLESATSYRIWVLPFEEVEETEGDIGSTNPFVTSGAASNNMGVVIEPPVLNDLCVGSGFTDLGRLTIRERTGSDSGPASRAGFANLSGIQTFTLRLPNGFVFESGFGVASVERNEGDAGFATDFANDEVDLIVGNNTITLIYEIEGTDVYDAVHIDGLRVAATQSDLSELKLTRPAGNSAGNADVANNAPGAGRVHATLSSLDQPPAPELADLSVSTLCSIDEILDDFDNSVFFTNRNANWYSDPQLNTLVSDEELTAANLVAELSLTEPMNKLFYVVNESGNCQSDIAEVRVTISKNPEIDPGPDQVVCGGSRQLGGSPTLLDGQTGANINNYTFAWDIVSITGENAPALTPELFDQIFNGNENKPNPQVQIPFNNNEDTDDDIVYVFELLVTDANGCESSIEEVEWTVEPFPVSLGLEGGVTSVPNNVDKIRIEKSPAGGQLSGLFVNKIGDDFYFTPEGAEEGTYEITYTVNNGSCIRTEILEVNVTDGRVIVEGLDPQYCEEDLINETVTTFTFSYNDIIEEIRNEYPGEVLYINRTQIDPFFPNGFMVDPAITEVDPPGEDEGQWTIDFQHIYQEGNGTSFPYNLNIQIRETQSIFGLTIYSYRTVEFQVLELITPPEVNFHNFDVEYCDIDDPLPLQVNLDGTVTNDGSFAYYTLDGGGEVQDGPFALASKELEPQVLGAGIYRLEYTSPEIEGCQTSIQQDFVIYETPSEPAFDNGPDFEFCEGESITDLFLISSPVVNDEYLIYESDALGENIGLISQTTGASPSFSANNIFGTSTPAPGEYYFLITQRTARGGAFAGCESEGALINITIYEETAPPILSLDNQYNYCLEEGIEDISLNVAAEEAGTRFQWFRILEDDTEEAITNLASSNLSVNESQLFPDGGVIPTGVYEFFVIKNENGSMDFNGCDSERTNFEIEVFIKPGQANTDVSFEYCEGDIIEDLEVGAAPGGQIPVWFTDATETSEILGIADPFNPTADELLGSSSPSPGDYEVYVRLQEQGNFCFGDPLLVNITVFPIPNAPEELENDSPYCFGESINALEVGGENVRWFADEDGTDQIGSGNVFNPSLANPEPGIYRFYATQTVNNCESPIQTLEIEVLPLPVLSFTNLEEVYCQNDDSFTLQASPSGGQFSGPGVSLVNGNYRFSPLEAAQELGNVNSLSVIEIQYNFTNASGCQDSIQTSVSINPLPFAGFLSAMSLEYCVNDPDIELVGSSQGDVIGTFSVNSVTLPNNTLNPSFFGVGTHTLRYTTVDNVTGCENFVETEIQIFGVPLSSFLSADGCLNEEVPFSYNANVGQDIIDSQFYRWNFGDGNTAEGLGLSELSHVYESTGQFNVSLEVESDDGCSSSLFSTVVNVGVLENLSFELTDICLGQPSTFVPQPQVNTAGAITSVTWNFGGEVVQGQVVNGQARPIQYQFNSSGLFEVRLEMSNATGCVEEFVRNIFILPTIDQYPYAEDFEGAGAEGWQVDQDDSILPSWELGSPDSDFLSSSSSGNNAWVTSLTGDYLSGESSWVFSPCFDLTGLDRPMVSFNRAFSFDTNREGVVLQYSTDGGFTWRTLGQNLGSQSQATGLFWYNQQNIVGNPGNQSFDEGVFGWAGLDNTSAGSDNPWQLARHALDPIDPMERNQVRFRFAFSSIANGNGNGFAFDDFSITNREKFVLVEQFVSSLTTSSTAIRNLRNIGLAMPMDMTFINYFNSISGENPIFNRNPDDPSARTIYYGVETVPVSILDGSFIEGATNQIQPWTQNDLNLTTLERPVFNISVDLMDTDPEELAMVVNLEALEDLEEQEITVHVAVLKGELSTQIFSDYTGSLQQVPNVLMKLLPNGAGTTFESAFGEGDEVSFEVDWRVKHFELDDLMRIVVFIQSNENKSILQTHQIELSGKEGTGVTSLRDMLKNEVNLYPNPANKVANVFLGNAGKSSVQWKLIDQRGVTLMHGKSKAGTEMLQLQVQDLPSGMYHLVLESELANPSTKKLIIAR